MPEQLEKLALEKDDLPKKEEVPLWSEGFALEAIDKEQHGDAVFNIEGTLYLVNVYALTEIPEYGHVIIVKHPNQVIWGSPTLAVSTGYEVTQKFDESVSKNTDILESDISIAQSQTLRVVVAVKDALVVKVLYRRGTTTKKVDLKGGDTLTANALYRFPVDVWRGDNMNFQFDTATTIKLFRVYKTFQMVET